VFPQDIRSRALSPDRFRRFALRADVGLSSQLPMGSLIKKRRKRMRKKKHKKMLKRTRFQRRNK
jgi:Mitochondrial domain of unknown function (DUF1713)